MSERVRGGQTLGGEAGRVARARGYSSLGPGNRDVVGGVIPAPGVTTVAGIGRGHPARHAGASGYSSVGRGYLACELGRGVGAAVLGRHRGAPARSGLPSRGRRSFGPQRVGTR